MATRRAHGFDISYWQRDIDMEQVTADDLDFAILKASQKNWSDDAFEDLIAKTSRIPIRGAYHYYTTRTYHKSYIQPLTGELSRQNDKNVKTARKAKDKAKDAVDKAKKGLKGASKKEKTDRQEKLNRAERDFDAADAEYRKWNNPVKVLGGQEGVDVFFIQIKAEAEKGPSWKEQADHFIETVQGKGLAFYALDLERGPNIHFYIGQSSNQFTSEDLADVNEWMKYVSEKTGKPVLLYTSPSVYGELLRMDEGDNLKDWKLWLAAYDLGDRETTNPIKETKQYNLKRSDDAWSIWQYSADKNQQGPRYGLPKPPQLGSRPCPDDEFPCRGIDLNVFNGTLEEMRAWLDPEGTVIEVPPAVPPDKPVDTPPEEPKDAGENESQDGDKQGAGGIEEPTDGKTLLAGPTYPGMTNQDVLNLFNRAAGGDANWWSWVDDAELEGLAASQAVRNEIYVGPKFEDLPALSESQKKSLLAQLPGGEPPAQREPGFWVEVKVKQTTCQKIKSGKDGRDKKGKPAMIPHSEPVQLSRGDRLWVSSTHRESTVDAGDGVILAMGRVKYYLVLESPGNERAVGTFVLKEDTVSD